MIISSADVGGTSIKLGVVEHSSLISRAEVPTPTGPDAASRVLDIVVDHALASREKFGASHVSLVVPGIVDERAGVGVWSENLGWRDVPFRDQLAARTNMPATLGHDVAAAGIAEIRIGAAKGAEQAAVIVIGTGISALLVADSRPIRAGGLAGEIGHSIVVPGGRACVCGAHGCLEAIASAASIARSYSERAELVDGAADVLRRMHAGESVAREVWLEAVDALAIAIRQLQAITGCTTIVIGGGLSLAGDSLIAPLRDRVATARTIQPPANIVAASLGADAGMLGAALLAMESVGSSGDPGRTA